ncbi:hypothetical protein PI125_g24686 [Phytophthora idaei]|nr:hypothetical protein PI125_g24686 [Phytophthora idaei]KAG3156477.1 hypothetical protein PI126_g8738 [Phytophthora idaei]
MTTGITMATTPKGEQVKAVRLQTLTVDKTLRLMKGKRIPMMSQMTNHRLR